MLDKDVTAGTATSVTFNKNAGITVNAGGTFNWVDGKLLTSGTGVITNMGTFLRTPGTGTSSFSDLAFVNSGTFQIQNGMGIEFDGADAAGFAFDQSAGTCELSEGADLDVKGGSGFHMGGGNLWVDGATGSVIALGNVLIDGGLISLNHDHATATGLLQITGGSLTLKGTGE